MKKIIVQSHAECIFGVPTGDTEKDQYLGHLTPEGKVKVVRKTEGLLSSIGGNLDQIKFLIIYSPTCWIAGSNVCQPAKETAFHISDTIHKNGGRASVQMDFRLTEPLIFQTPFSEFLGNQYGDQYSKFWEAYYDDTFKNERMKSCAEGPKDIAQRISLVIGNAIDFLKTNDGRIVVWLITHNNCLIPFGMSLRIPLDERPKCFNDGLELEYYGHNDLAVTIHDKTFSGAYTRYS